MKNWLFSESVTLFNNISVAVKWCCAHLRTGLNLCEGRTSCFGKRGKRQFFFFLKVEDSDERRSVRCSSLELPAAPLHSADTGWFVCSTQCASA